MADNRKVALITGASQGIGAGLVEGYRTLGYRLAINSRSIEERGDEDVISIQGDIGDPETARRLVDAAVDQFGRIDTLVNNAGIFIGKPFIDYTLDDFNAVMTTNVAGFFHATQAAGPQMLKQGHGHILNITTSLVDQPMAAIPTGLAALSKGGLNAVTRSLAIEYARKGVRVNAVSPGIIVTPMHEGSDHAFLATLHPMGRLGAVEEIVHAALYLEAAGFVTGEVIHVDGGAHAGQW